jgi:hypothetical protein
VNLGDAYPSPLSYTSPAYPVPGQVLIHELTHAWQIANSSYVPSLMCSGLWNQAQYIVGKNIYAIDESLPFGVCNLEQQAHIVDMWFQGGSSTLHRYFRFIEDNILKRSATADGPGKYWGKWAYCVKCYGVYWAETDHGYCPATGQPHQPGGDRFMVQRLASHWKPRQPDDPLSPFPGWGTCHKCRGLWFEGGQHHPRCPAGGQHDPRGGFVLKILVSKDYYVRRSIRYRDDFFLCEKCFSLYNGPPAAGGVNEMSVCPETRQPHRPRGQLILEYDVGWP